MTKNFSTCFTDCSNRRCYLNIQLNPQCCSRECAAGCIGPRDDQCIVSIVVMVIIYKWFTIYRHVKTSIIMVPVLPTVHRDKCIIQQLNLLQPMPILDFILVLFVWNHVPVCYHNMLYNDMLYVM